MTYTLTDAIVQKVVYGFMLLEHSKERLESGYQFTVAELADCSECCQPAVRMAIRTLREASLIQVTSLNKNKRSFKFLASHEKLFKTFTLINKNMVANGIARMEKMREQKATSVATRIDVYNQHVSGSINRSHVVDSAGRTFCLPNANTVSVKDSLDQLRGSGIYITVRERSKMKKMHESSASSVIS